MATRNEFEGSIRIAGGEGHLFVSSGAADDYLELTFPDGFEVDSPTMLCIEAIASRHDLDVQPYPGPPAIAGITALYINAPERKAAPQPQRIEAILSLLAGASPEIDFGDLLPGRAASPPEAESATVGEVSRESSLPRALPVRRPDLLLSSLRALRVEKARGLASAGQMRKAVTLLEEVLRDAPGDSAAGSLLDAIGLLERREKRLRKEPASLQANLEVGFSYLTLDRNEDAVRALERTRRLGPNVYLAHLLHGIALHRLGQSAPARNAYLRAGRLRPGDTVHLDLMAALDRGEPPVGLAETGPLATPAARPSSVSHRLAYVG